MFLSAILEKNLKYILKNNLIFFLKKKITVFIWVNAWLTDKLTLYCHFMLPGDYSNNHKKCTLFLSQLWLALSFTFLMRRVFEQPVSSCSDLHFCAVFLNSLSQAAAIFIFVLCFCALIRVNASGMCPRAAIANASCVSAHSYTLHTAKDYVVFII